jgi:hypothetical protein
MLSESPILRAYSRICTWVAFDMQMDEGRISLQCSRQHFCPFLSDLIVWIHVRNNTRAERIHICRVYLRDREKWGRNCTPDFAPVLLSLHFRSHSLNTREKWHARGMHPYLQSVHERSIEVRDELRSRLRASTSAPSFPIWLTEYTWEMTHALNASISAECTWEMERGEGRIALQTSRQCFCSFSSYPFAWINVRINTPTKTALVSVFSESFIEWDHMNLLVCYFLNQGRAIHLLLSGTEYRQFSVLPF